MKLYELHWVFRLRLPGSGMSTCCRVCLLLHQLLQASEREVLVVFIPVMFEKNKHVLSFGSEF